MKPCYEGLKEIGVDVNEIWRKMLWFWSKYRVVKPLFRLSHEMKPCYEGLKEIGVDVNEIWREILDFGVSIGLLPLILIVSWNETLLWRSERNQSWCQWDMKENVVF